MDVSTSSCSAALSNAASCMFLPLHAMMAAGCEASVATYK
jgi:hypothetical protein